MATPNAAIPRDLEQRIRNIEANLRALSAQSLRQRQLAVLEGDFVVSGGGSIIVRDGGAIDATYPADLGGGAAAHYGQWLLNGATVYGFGAENPDGIGIFAALYNPATEAAEISITAPAIVGHRSANTGGFQIDYPTAYATRLMGGLDGVGFDSALYLAGNGTFWVGAKDGGNAVYIPMRASSFDVQSSGEVKDVAGDLEAGALDKVRAVPIKRWRYKSGPKAAPADTKRAPVSLTKTAAADTTPASDAPTEPPAEAPEQIGPLAEDIPADIGNPDDPDPENRTVSISSSLWLLWKATQELAATVDTQAAQIEALTARLDALEAKGPDHK